MPLLVQDCPRCGADEITFDVEAASRYSSGSSAWMHRFEAFSICRRCFKSTVFRVELTDYKTGDAVLNPSYWQKSGDTLNHTFKVLGHVTISDMNRRPPPEHLPADIVELFKEGASCLAIDCFNAAGTMFRLCLDRATRDLLPPEGEEGPDQPNRKQRRDLGLRLPWLIQNGRLPGALADLASCVREDGNDGAHVGNLSKADAEDLLEFTEVLLERLYTEPAKLALAEVRRAERRQTPRPV